MTRKRKRRLTVDASLFAAGMAGMFAIGRADVIAEALSRGAFGEAIVVEERMVFDCALYSALLVLGVLAARMLFNLARRIGDLRSMSFSRAQLGTVTVEFTLVLPVYIAVYGGVVQLALMANASLMIDYAAFQAARTAIVYYERQTDLSGDPPSFFAEDVTDEGREKAWKAAAVCLAPISPVVTAESADPVALDLVSALNHGGTPWANTMLNRMAFALGADADGNLVTNVSLTTGPPQSGWTWEHIDPTSFLGDPDGYINRDRHMDTDYIPLPLIVPPRQIRAEVTYQFKLQIPGIAAVLAPDRHTYAGMSGRFVGIKAACDLQATAARKGSLFNLLGGMPF